MMIEFLLFATTWLVPLFLLAYMLRMLNTMVLGIRSINAATQRTAAALERMEAGGNRPS